MGLIRSPGPADELQCAEIEAHLRELGRKESLHPSAVEPVSDRASIGRRIIRTLSRFLTAVLLGVGATLAWQSHGGQAKEMVRTRAASLSWRLPVSTTKSPAAASTSPDLVQQLEPMARNLAVMRLNLEQLTARQEQMAQNIATPRAAGQHIREKPPSPPPPRPAAIPPRKPPQPAAESSAVQSSPVSPSPPPAQSPLVLR